ncbi:hypothetical protein CW362_10515 [Streptomyces populi]|uniref:Streptomyces killer toxin-like beta/gamma crystallin domain-containing protein n=1 Tax=Streptomyces populi TaxID=2058924 RepID=A0A2I0STC9_9ACTN|nr:hypothetical protein [Streptomyces populi]PKT73153.1 hypothetical protein CW362_10515 [Streptomyces populi]
MKKALATLAIVGAAASSVLALAPAASADSCARTNLTTGYRTWWSTAYKSSTSGCHDLNVVMADAPAASADSYVGFYVNSSGNWAVGTRGYVYIPDGTYAVNKYILVSDLSGGREFGVGALNNAGGAVTIAH